MVTWRAAEQLPAALGSLDLVIIDEASQTDVLPALLRRRKILVVRDDRRVSSPQRHFVRLPDADARFPAGLGAESGLSGGRWAKPMACLLGGAALRVQDSQSHRSQPS
jgi:hypothetical protein